MYEEYLKHFEDTISEEIKEYAYEVVLSQSRYAFVKREKGKYVGYCSNCNKEYEILSVKHNDIIECPCCKCNCKVKLTRYGRKILIDRACFIRYDKSKVDNETLVARAFVVTRDYSGDYTKVITEYRELARYVFAPNDNAMFTQGYWMSKPSGKWDKTSSIYKYNKDGLANLNNFISFSNLDNEIKDTRFQYSQYEIYREASIDSSMLKFFEVYNKYPIIESLTKMGFGTLVNMKIRNKSLEGAVNWRGKDVFKFLKLNRGQVKEIQASKVRITPWFLNMYRENIKNKYKLSISDIKELEYILDSYYRKNIREYANLGRVYKYITKQFDSYKRWIDKRGVLITWIDYLCDCEKLKLNVKDEKVLFPKDVYQQHQNFIKQIEYEKDERLRELFKKQEVRRKKLYFECNGIIAIPANSQKELIEEGKALNHCVGGYAERCAEGKTDIILIRKIEEADKPYCTMEIANGKVQQVRANRNAVPPKEVLDFVEVYKSEKLNKKSRKRKGGA